MSDHVHKWAFFELDDKMAAEVGVRFMGLCVDKKVYLCAEKKYIHALPPGYRKVEATTEFGAKTDNGAGAYVFDLKKLREQLGADADLEPFLEKAAAPAPEKPAAPPPAKPSSWSDDIPTES